MNNEIVIHIGLHKTASTTLQEFFFPRCQDVNLLLAANREVRSFLELISKRDSIYFDAGKAKEIISKHLSGNKINLISSEGLSGRPWTALLEKGLDHRSNIIHNIKAVFPEAKIVLIIRRQDKYAISFYREYLKWGGTKPIKKLIDLEDEFGSSLMPIERFDYLPYARRLNNDFPGKVLILPFELLVENSSEFLSQLTQFIGTKTPPQDLPKNNSTKLADLGFEISRLLNYCFRSYLNPGGILPGIPEKDGARWGMRSPVHYIQDYWPGNGKINPNGEIATTAAELLRTLKGKNEVLDSEFKLNLKEYGYY